MRTIEFYRTSPGRCPIEEFLDSLSDRDTQKIAWVLRLVERLDMVPQQYFKKLVGTNNIWEIRVEVGGVGYRFLGFFDESKVLVLTNGFAKKQQKTPSREIDLAIERRKDHLQRRKS